MAGWAGPFSPWPSRLSRNSPALYPWKELIEFIRILFQTKIHVGASRNRNEGEDECREGFGGEGARLRKAISPQMNI